MTKGQIAAAEYASQKFDEAIYTLATGHGALEERITDAWIYSLIPLLDVHFPCPELLERWKALHDQWRRLSDLDADQLYCHAREVCELRYAVHRRIEEAREAMRR